MYTIDIGIYKLDGDIMIKFNSNFKKYLLILPIYIFYIIVLELILGCSLGDIWDDLLQKFGISESKKTHKLV